MEIKAIDHNVNIIAMRKNGKNYGMCCAWCTQAGADKLICCVGPQSTTGQALEKGDIVGFSNLNKAQMMTAFQLGDLQKHSADTDKLAGVDYSVDDGAILISGANSDQRSKRRGEVPGDRHSPPFRHRSGKRALSPDAVWKGKRRRCASHCRPADVICGLILIASIL